MYIRGFDGLRAIALILVFLTHKTNWGDAAQVGFAGVWVFFLLSGFLITAQLSAGRVRIEARRTTLRQEATAFWIKRVMRIFPAYFVLLALVMPLYLIRHGNVTGLVYHLTYLSNFYFQAHPSQFLTTFAHFWSLAVEEQFYIFFAPLLLLIPSRFSAQACGAVVAASLLRRFWLAQDDIPAFVVYIDSLVNFGLLALGGLLFLQRDALIRRLQAVKLDRPAVGWIALLLTIACPPFGRYFAGSNLVLLQVIYVAGAIAAALLIMIVWYNQHCVLTGLLERSALRSIGRVSYGLYLYNDYVKVDLPERVVHFASQKLLDLQLESTWTARSLASPFFEQLVLPFCGFIVCLCVTLALARLSWTLIEKPALRLRDRLLAVASGKSSHSKASSPPETVKGNADGFRTVSVLIEQRRLSSLH